MLAWIRVGKDVFAVFPRPVAVIEARAQCQLAGGRLVVSSRDLSEDYLFMLYMSYRSVTGGSAVALLSLPNNGTVNDCEIFYVNTTREQQRPCETQGVPVCKINV